MFFEAANEIFKHFGTDSFITDITKLATKVLGGVTPVEYLLLAIVSPLVYEFAVDNDGVNDNNGVLPGYGTVEIGNNISNIYSNIIGIFNEIVKYFELFATVIMNMIF